MSLVYYISFVEWILRNSKNILYAKFILYQLCQALLYLMQCTLQSSQNRGAW